MSAFRALRCSVGYPVLVRLPTLLLVLVLPLVTACGKVQFESTPGTPGVGAEELFGEWVGTWTSDGTAGTGTMSFRAQRFGEQLVFNVDMAHPCLTNTRYQLVFDGEQLELRLAGAPVMIGELQTDRRFVGTYSCLEDSGSWTVQWQRELPPVPDFSGIWQGEILLMAGTTPLELEFVQSVSGGVIALDGWLRLPLLLDGQLPIDGVVRLRQNEFEISLVTPAGTTPQIVIGGFGNPTAMAVTTGLVVTSGAPLPFTQGQTTFALQPELP